MFGAMVVVRVEDPGMKTGVERFLCMGVLISSIFALGGKHDQEANVKRGILLVASGTSVPEARVAFEHIGQMAGERFDGMEIRWAYASSSIRRKWARAGESIDSPLAALARMKEDGFTHVVVQSLHIAAGAEYHDLARTVGQFRSGPNAFDTIELGKPLISRRADVRRVVQTVLSSLPQRQKGEAVVLMGHGSKNGRAELTYVATAAECKRADPLCGFGVVAGMPGLDDVVADLKRSGAKRAMLVPFMSVAGDHARNDLAGEGEDSWKSVISKLGIECVPVMTGLAEHDGVVSVWLDHLATALGNVLSFDGLDWWR